MTATVPSLMTFDEFEFLPDQPGKLELLQGELIELPPAKLKHHDIAHRMLWILKEMLADAHHRGLAAELGVVYHEMGYRFGNRSWLQPDLSVTHAGQESGDYFMNSPALAVGVVSDGNTANQIEGKVGEYLAGGAREVWVLYPKRRHLWIYRPDGTGEIHTTPFQSALLGGATIDVAAFVGG